jgi:hypothetical protein
VTSRWTSHETGATVAYRGHCVSLLWQSKHARFASSRVDEESQAGSFITGGLVRSAPYGTSWMASAIAITAAPDDTHQFRQIRFIAHL